MKMLIQGPLLHLPQKADLHTRSRENNLQGLSNRRQDSYQSWSLVISVRTKDLWIVHGRQLIGSQILKFEKKLWDYLGLQFNVSRPREVWIIRLTLHIILRTKWTELSPSNWHIIFAQQMGFIHSFIHSVNIYWMPPICCYDWIASSQNLH